MNDVRREDENTRQKRGSPEGVGKPYKNRGRVVDVDSKFENAGEGGLDSSVILSNSQLCKRSWDINPLTKTKTRLVLFTGHISLAQNSKRHNTWVIVI